MTPPHLIVTGFGPFPRVPVNPSAALARRIGALGARGLGGVAVRTLMLRTAYEAIPRMLEPALAEEPVAMLMIGVAVSAKRVRVEMRAQNRTSRLFPDASGRVSTRLTLERDGPAQRRGAGVPQALATLHRRGIPATLSRNAGRYLCNASYFRALRDGGPVLFLHIPRPASPVSVVGRKPSAKRRPSEAALAAACLDIARGLAARGRALTR